MKLRPIVSLARISLFIAFSFHAEAQQPPKLHRIGFLTNAPFSAVSAGHEAFQQGLRELGYIEGKNIIIEWRSSEGNRDRQRLLAAELVRLKVEVIVAPGSGDIRTAKKATATIPIVMIQGGDLLEAVSWPVSRDRAGMSLDWQPFARS